jgi:hypothetical protein
MSSRLDLPIEKEYEIVTDVIESLRGPQFDAWVQKFLKCQKCGKHRIRDIRTYIRVFIKEQIHEKRLEAMEEDDGK